MSMPGNFVYFVYHNEGDRVVLDYGWWVHAEEHNYEDAAEKIYTKHHGEDPHPAAPPLLAGGLIEVSDIFGPKAEWRWLAITSTGFESVVEPTNVERRLPGNR